MPHTLEIMKTGQFFAALGAVLLGISAPLTAQPVAGSAPKIEPRVLLIATYETGNDTGDTPGELQYWAEREALTQSIPVPGLEHPLLGNGRALRHGERRHLTLCPEPDGAGH